MKHADEVVMVDLTPGALLNRLKRGVVYTPDKAERALKNFFREPVLVALREMALRQTAHEVDLRHLTPDGSDAGSGPGGASFPSRLHGSNERLLLHVSSDPATAALIRRGRRLADYLQADCIAVAVERSAKLDSLPAEERDRLNKHLDFARNLHIDTRVLEGEDAARPLLSSRGQTRSRKSSSLARIGLRGKPLLGDRLCSAWCDSPQRCASPLLLIEREPFRDERPGSHHFLTREYFVRARKVEP